MTDTPAPDAAVDRDALDAWMRERGLMLIRNGYFADLTRELAAARRTSTRLHEEVAALRAVEVAARALVVDTVVPDPWGYAIRAALDALPPADVPDPAPPPGEDVERLREEWLHGLSDGRGRHVPLRRSWPELVKLLDALVDDDAVPAGPQPAGETEGRLSGDDPRHSPRRGPCPHCACGCTRAHKDRCVVAVPPGCVLCKWCSCKCHWPVAAPAPATSTSTPASGGEA